MNNVRVQAQHTDIWLSFLKSAVKKENQIFVELHAPPPQLIAKYKRKVLNDQKLISFFTVQVFGRQCVLLLFVFNYSLTLCVDAWSNDLSLNHIIFEKKRFKWKNKVKKKAQKFWENVSEVRCRIKGNKLLMTNVQINPVKLLKRSLSVC